MLTFFNMNKLANITVGAIFALLLIRTGEKYFTAVWVVFALFLFIDIFYCYKNQNKFLPELHHSKIMVGSILLFYGALILSSLVNRVEGSLAFSIMLAKFTVPMWMILYINGKYSAVKGAVTGIIVGSFVSSGFCLYQYFFLLPGKRVYGLFQNPNLEGAVLEVVIPLTAYCLIAARDKYVRGISLAAIIVSYMALYLTFSRGAMLGLLIGTGLSASLLLLIRHGILHIAFIKKVVLYTGILCLIDTGLFLSTFEVRPVYQTAAGSSIQQTDNFSKETHDNIPQKHINQSDMERVRMIQASYMMWKDHKIAGIGLNSWKENYYGKYHPASSNYNTDFGMPHNMIIYFLACSGLIGLIGYLIFTFGTGMGIVIEGKSRGFAMTAAVLAVHVAFFIHGLVDQTIICRFCSYLYYGFMGLFITSSFEQETKKEEA